MKHLFILVAFLFGCDAHVTGETTHTVQGEATVRMEVVIDYCKDVPPEQKLECLETFREFVEMMQDVQEQEDSVEDIE